MPELEAERELKKCAERVWKILKECPKEEVSLVNIPELRKRLNWPHEVFDEMLRELRDDETIILHVTDLTIFEPEEFFYDELDNSRMGMVTWKEETSEKSYELSA